jgi:hypothetical protein
MLGGRPWSEWIAEYSRSHRRFLFVGLRWWVAKIRGRA